MTDAPPFVAALRAELVAAAGREVTARARRRRWRRRGTGALVAVAATLVAVALVVGLPRSTPPAAADVVVRVVGPEVQVTLVDVEHRPDRIEAAVRRAGIDLTVDEVPVGPGLVGRFLGDASTGPLPPELRPLDGTGGAFTGFALPSGWPGSLHLRVGRPARPGEAYAVFGDALAPGEVLACRPLLGRPVREVLPTLRDLPLDLRFDAVAPPAVVHLSPTGAAAPAWSEWVVTGLASTGPRSVVVHLDEPGQPAPPPPPGCP